MQNIAKTIYCDVAVIGGGVGGCAAAVEAGRRGMRVVLFERGISLGGLATNGYVPSVAGCVEGLSLEFCKRLEKIGQLRKTIKYSFEIDTRENYYHCPAFEPEYGKLVFEEMLLQAGARIMYDSTFIDAKVENSEISEAIFYTKGGLMSVKASMFIDATGDGDVAAAAGVPYEVGGQDFAGLNMSTTLGNRWAGADLVKYQQAEEAYKAEQRERGIKLPVPLVYDLEEKAIANGEIAFHITNKSTGFYRILLPNTDPTDADFCTFTFHSYYCHNNDAADLTRQVLEQRQQIKQFHAFLRKYVPGFERVRLVGTGSMQGVRDCRRIFGEYMLKGSDVACGVKFDDGIARFPEMFDTHHPTSPEWVWCRHIHMEQPEGTAVTEENETGVDCDVRMHPFGIPAGVPARPDPKDWCEVPYRCLVPKKIDNLLTAGRCCSAEFHANGAMRIIAPAMGTGQAAGIAVAMAVNENIRPRDIDGTIVRAKMIESGVKLNDPCDGPWATLREQDGEYVINRGDFVIIAPRGN